MTQLQIGEQSFDLLQVPDAAGHLSTTKMVRSLVSLLALGLVLLGLSWNNHNPELYA